MLTRRLTGMYPAINRYFLRIQGEHGAFPDLNRPPAFMSLFCNSNEDSKVAQEERTWALEVLRDSFLEERCWGPLRACHAPELLMSTISMRLGIDQIQQSHNGLHVREFDLILGVLLRILVFGGVRAKAFMIKQAGLLHWLGGILGGRPLTFLEQSKTSSMLILRLMMETLISVADGVHDDQWQYALHGMASAACHLWNSAVVGSEVWNFSAEGMGLLSVSELLTSVLCSLYKLTKYLPVASREAMNAALLNETLSKMVWRDDSDRSDILEAILAFPITLGQEDDNLAIMKKLIDLVLATENQGSIHEENSLTALLSFIVSLMKEHEDALQSEDIFALFCRLRPMSCRYLGTRNLWMQIYTEVDG